MDEKLVTENMGLINLAIKRMHLTAKTEDDYQAYYDAGLEGLIRGHKSMMKIAVINLVHFCIRV